MILFHRILLVIAGVVAFFAGALNAGAQDIAQQKRVEFMLMQPITVLVQMEIRHEPFIN